MGNRVSARARKRSSFPARRRLRICLLDGNDSGLALDTFGHAAQALGCRVKVELAAARVAAGPGSIATATLVAMKKICATASVMLLFTICGVSAGDETKKVATDELERQLDVGLMGQGRLADSIDCPDELDKDKGAEVECTVVIDSLEHIMTVAFDRVDGDLVYVQIADEPNRVLPDGLVHALEAYLEEQGTPADVIDCPDALDADKGSQVECAVVRNGHGYTATFMSNGVDGTTVDVHYAVSEGPSWWPRSWLAGYIQAALNERTDTAPHSVECPDDLDADQGSEVECTFVGDGLELTATLTSNGVGIDLLTARYPNRMTREGLEAQVTQAVIEAAGQDPDNVACPEQGLAAKVGETQHCMVTAGADRFGVTVTVTSVGRGAMDLDITRREQSMH